MKNTETTSWDKGLTCSSEEACKVREKFLSQGELIDINYESSNWEDIEHLDDTIYEYLREIWKTVNSIPELVVESKDKEAINKCFYIDNLAMEAMKKLKGIL